MQLLKKKKEKEKKKREELTEDIQVLKQKKGIDTSTAYCLNIISMVYSTTDLLKEAGGYLLHITLCFSELRSRKLPLEVERYYVFILSTING